VNISRNTNIDRLLAMCAGNLKDRLQWYKENARKPYPDRHIKIYENAYSEGWRAAVACGQRHGMIK